VQRQILAALLISLPSLALLGGACTAHLEEGCLSGPCGPIGIDAGVKDAGEAGPNPCTGMDPPATGDYPCPVFDVINRNCRPCHQNPPLQGAPFPLMTFEDTQAPHPTHPTSKVYVQMNIQIRPGALPRMPLGKPPLSDADLATLGDWLNMCAPPVPDGTGCGCPGMGCSPP
jgi:hypothetical protein